MLILFGLLLHHVLVFGRYELRSRVSSVEHAAASASKLWKLALALARIEYGIGNVKGENDWELID